MILGVGVDLVEVGRFDAMLEKWGERAEEKLFTGEEAAFCRSHAHPRLHLAARFAAKEAVMKALGHGVGQGTAFVEIEVVRDPEGRPCVALHGGTAELAREMSVRAIHLSLTHTDASACAFVVVEG